MRWLIDGYNVIRRSPELSSRERESLEAGRQALCALLARVGRARGDEFTVIFDGAGAGGSSAGLSGVRIIFSSARETADRVLARMAAARGGAVVSSDRAVQRAAMRAGAIAVSAEQFLARLEALPRTVAPDGDADAEDRDEPDTRAGRQKKGNPHRLGKKQRAAARALGRLDPRPDGTFGGERGRR